MKNKSRITMTVMFAAMLVPFLAFIRVGDTAPKPVELKVWSAWSYSLPPTKPYLQFFLEQLNEKGKAINLKAKYIGGPEVFSPFQGAESIKQGIVDMGFTAASYNTGVIPEADAMKLMVALPSKIRKNGGFDLMNKYHKEKGLVILCRTSTGIKFQGFLNKKRLRPDLKGLTMRVVPIYVPLVKAFGGTGANIAPAEVYTAMERGIVDGYWFGDRDIVSWGWNEVTKYIWGPAIWTSDVHILMNKKKWDSLDPAQREFLMKFGEEFEKFSYQRQIKEQEEITKKLLSGGLEQIKFSPEDEKMYIDVSNNAGWEAAEKKAPRVKELRPLVSKEGN